MDLHAVRPLIARAPVAAALFAIILGALIAPANAQVLRPLPPRPHPPVIWVPGDVTTIPQEYWGAIAYERSTGAQGYAYDYPTERDASIAALAACAEPACLVVLAFKNGCGLLIDGPTGPVTARGATAQEAETRARQQCVDPQCQVVAWACTR